MKLGDRLSPREKNVLALVCQGKANKTIAHDLGIAEATVKVLVRQIMVKSGATNRTQLAYRILTARAEAAEKRVAALREALVFYRDGWVSSPNRRYGGLEWCPKERLLDDCGNTARAALEAKP